MEVLEQVVQAAEDALERASERHLVVPAAAAAGAPGADRLQRNGVDVVRDEAAVRAGRVAERLAHHAAQHRAQPVRVAVVVVRPHLLQRRADAHLPARHGCRCVDEVQVRQLPVDAVVHNVHAFEARVERIVDGYDALQRAALQRQRVYQHRCR